MRIVGTIVNTYVWHIVSTREGYIFNTWMGIYFVLGEFTNPELGKITNLVLEIGTVLTYYSLLSTYLVVVYRAIPTFNVSTTSLRTGGGGGGGGGGQFTQVGLEGKSSAFAEDCKGVVVIAAHSGPFICLCTEYIFTTFQPLYTTLRTDGVISRGPLRNTTGLRSLGPASSLNDISMMGISLGAFIGSGESCSRSCGSRIAHLGVCIQCMRRISLR